MGRTEPPRRPGPIALPLGPAAQDPSTGTPPLFRPVARGASPHVAIMGGVGSGKTRTALFMLAELAKQAPVPLVAFDFKGDLTGDATGLDRSFAAEVLDPLERPIPLDVLAFDPAKPHARELAAQRLRDSLAALKGGAFGAVQRGLLGDAAARALASHRPCRLEDVRDALVAVYEEHGKARDGAVETLVDLCRFPLFEPKEPPADFFGRARVIRLRQDLPDLVRSVVATLVTDALDRWLNAEPDTPVDPEGNRALRIVAVIDEAHRILGRKLPGLSNLVRMSRSKGGMIWLISQSPDDFETEDDDFLAEMGLVVAFATNARPGATKRIFGSRVELADLGKGEAFVRIRGEKARRLRIW
ncbi:MAG: type IV secretion system DNA-binding domain-containing protein [Geminicoccaceae bacterium]|nr:type IV secretion system DNA-binding domain-containing protein [Geminicoccaceae bacterium]